MKSVALHSPLFHLIDWINARRGFFDYPRASLPWEFSSMKLLPLPKSFLCLLAAALTTLILTGCVGAVPIPVTSHVDYGHRLKSAQTGFIQPGRTTRDEVIAELGTNFATFPRTSSIAYTWEMRGGGGLWGWAVACPQGGAGGGGSWAGGWRGFLVAFDERGLVRSAQYRRLSCRRSLDANAERWLTHLPKSPPADLLVVQ